MPEISMEVEVSAPRGRVWEVVSDVDHEPEYWHGTREVRNFAKKGNSIEREITQNFMGTKILQHVELYPMDSVVVEYLKGTTVGVKRVSIESIGGDRQRVKVSWKVRFTGLLWLATPFISGHIVRGTENALQRVKEVSEGTAGGKEVNPLGVED